MSPSVAIETSERPGSLALAFGTQQLHVDLADSRAHARDLLPELDRLYASAGWTPTPAHPIHEVFVGLGPGSYTGLRVGIATALGLARGSAAVVRGVPSFETLCYGSLRPGEVGSVVRNARANRFYHARYERTEDDVRQLEAESALRAGELRERLASFRGVVLTDPSSRVEAELTAHAEARWVEDAAPSAADLLHLGKRRLASEGPHALDALDPLYLRAFGE